MPAAGQYRVMKVAYRNSMHLLHAGTAMSSKASSHLQQASIDVSYSCQLRLAMPVWSLTLISVEQRECVCACLQQQVPFREDERSTAISESPFSIVLFQVVDDNTPVQSL